MTTIVLRPRGRFSLGEALDFGFGPHRSHPGEPMMRMAFTVDGYTTQAAVAVRQADDDGDVSVEVFGAADPEVVTDQVTRVLSLDVDATGWDALGGRDPFIGRLQSARPGLRPPLFHSAYEAAAWAVLSARRPARQMAVLRERLSSVHGATFEVAGETRYAFPTPEQLLAVREFDGLPLVKLQRLHGVARVAAEGGLDTATLRAADPAAVDAQLRTLDGIGPFSALLVTVRALGHTDVLPEGEPLVLEVLGELLGRGGPVAPGDFAELAAAWSPWRTWAGVFIRSAGPRLLPPDSEVGRRSTSR
ncbi:DNA-3-methyladenine glycosylase family protein [Jatrophihabitans sp. YIM 134969]